jgi:hypothetical protein
LRKTLRKFELRLGWSALRAFLAQGRSLPNLIWLSLFGHPISFEIVLENDNGSSLAVAFRDACEALQPKVAFLAHHLDQAASEYVLDRERWVLGGQANRLASQRLVSSILIQTLTI